MVGQELRAGKNGSVELEDPEQGGGQTKVEAV
jgi:hypothetical protein